MKGSNDMSYCSCCYRKFDGGKLCPECLEKVHRGERVYLKASCPECKLHWSGYYSPGRGPDSHTRLRCMQVKTKRIDPDRDEGKVPLRCSICGLEGWVTKNIGYIGARSIFWMGSGIECDCSWEHLEPILLHPERWE